MSFFRSASADPTETQRSRGDAGATLIEILLGITLLGTVVASTLTGLVTVITASALDRDHANAHAWLQTAADTLYARDLIECDENATDPAADMADMRAEYQDTVRQTTNPEGWSSPNIEIVDLQWWSIDIDQATGVGFEDWGTTCDSTDTNLQRVTMQVTAEDGRIVEQVEIIIGEFEGNTP